MGQWSKYVKALAALTPTGIASYLGQWLGLFGKVGLAHPQWQTQIENLSLGVSVLCALAVFVSLNEASKKTVLVAFSVTFAGFLGAIAACWGISIEVGVITTAEGFAAITFWWKLAYFSLLTVTSLTVLIFAMYLMDP